MSPRELADLLIKTFDRQRVVSVEQALSEALQSNGMAKGKAEGVAFDDAAGVLRELRRRRTEELPFRFADSDADRLVGKERSTPRDTSETAVARSVGVAAEPLLQHLTTISPDDFEVVCAAGVALAGGTDMRALCTGDEGGIDFYGRLPIRESHPAVAPGLVYTTILPKAVFVLGQAKRYDRGVKIGRPDIQKFKAQIEDCLKKYEGNARPPSHRVPESFYDRGELCLGIFATTASFAETAEGAAASSGIHLVDGMRLAQFFVFHGVGVHMNGGTATFDLEVFSRWLGTQRAQVEAAG